MVRARVYSFVTKGKTTTTGDADLFADAKKALKQKGQTMKYKDTIYHCTIPMRSRYMGNACCMVTQSIGGKHGCVAMYYFIATCEYIDRLFW